jgi:hypothetical protein
MIALVTTHEARGHDKDLGILAGALDACGATWEIVDWDDRTIDWSTFDIAVLRSTWDYYERLGEFLVWARGVGAKTTLYNPLDIVQWNVDKRYLIDLAQSGIPVMPTAFVSRDSDLDSLDLSIDVIVKPAVSAGSNNTARYVADSDAARAHVRRIMRTSGVALVQPYQATIDALGETGLVYLDGSFCHAFGKGAIFGVNDPRHNGLYMEESITARIATDAERALGDRVVQVLKDRFGIFPLYARVDMVTNDRGVPEIMEVELVEPSLYLHLDGDAPARAAAALVEAASRSPY